MGSSSSNTATAVQNINNNVFQSSEEQCISNCQSITSGNTIIISGSSVGNIDVDTQCSADASCAMTQTLDSQIQNILSAIAQQENDTSDLWPVSFKFDKKNNSVTISQAIRNNITQAMSAICQANSETITQNNTVVVKNSTTGNIYIGSQGGSANANCTMNNVARTVLFNQATANIDQTNKNTNALIAIFIAIAAIIIIVAIIALIVVGPAHHSKNASSTNGDAQLDKLLSETGDMSGLPKSVE